MIINVTGLHVSANYSCQILMTLEFSRHIFEQISNIKFHKNSSYGNPVVQCGWTDGRTNMTKLTVAVRHVANAPNKKKQPT